MRKVTWGMLGTATIAKRNTIAGMKKAPNCRLYAVAGRNPEKVDQYVKDYGFEKGYYSYDELLDDPEIEAVYIPLPNSLHYEWVLKAVAKKKHVLCEKPMANSVQECEQMIKASQTNNVKLAIGHIQRFFPSNIIVKEIIDSKQFGKLTMINEVRNEFYFSKSRPDWFLKKKLSGGGIVMNFAAHSIDKILSLAPGEISDVSAFCANFYR